MLKFTHDQWKAIRTRGRNILVSAAAGSGKTAVLIQRIIDYVTNSKKPVDIDRLLVVTFTDAAAAEMRKRIAEALSGMLEKDPADQNLKRQWSLLSKASISTIHSFCLKLIRTHSNLIDQDAGFRVGDTGEIRLLKSELIEQLFEDQYAEENNEDFFNLVEAYGGGKTKDEGLQELVLKLNEFARSGPRPERWLSKAADAMDIPASIDDTVWARLLEQEIGQGILGVLDGIEKALRLAGLPDGPAKYISALESDKAIMEKLLNTKGFTELYSVFEAVKFERLATYKAKDTVNEELKEMVKQIRDKEVKKPFDRLKKRIFYKPPSAMEEDVIRLAPFVKTLCKLTGLFMERYRQAKRDKNIVDFNDLEHYSLEILIDQDDKPTDIALELRSHFEEILIDEYQDSNLVQEMILSAISRQNSFMVGDVKQSIYKFRQARPEIFLGKYHDFSQSEEAENLRIDLSMNFRSRENVLRGVNFLFGQVMIHEIGGLDYDKKAALYTGAAYPESINGADSVELHLINDVKEQEAPEDGEAEERLFELSRLEKEAKVIAGRIRDLLDPADPFMLSDGKGGYRPAEYKDIVILMRSVSGAAETFLEELKRANIPAFAGADSGFFGSIEIITATSFLQIIDNPRQDIPLLTVLHSPVYGLDSSELMEIKGGLKKGCFYDCALAYLEQGENWRVASILEKFLTDLKKWRQLSVDTPIHHLISVVYADTGYYDYAGAMSGGMVRQANLDTLHRRAVQYEETSYYGLFHFIKYLEKLKKAGGDEGDANILSENENLVKIMTIHKSKGLEFPIVFVALLGKNFNLQDQRENLIMHQDYGLGLNYVDLDSRVRSNTIARMALSGLIRRENLAEELRILYVALTRAKEKLIMTGCVRSLSAGLRSWNGLAQWDEVRLPSWRILSANNFLDWIAPAFMRHKDGADLREAQNLSYGPEALNNYGVRCKTRLHWDVPEQFSLRTYGGKPAQEFKVSEIDKSDSIFKEIDEKFSWRYRDNKSLLLPTKVSISEIKRNYHKELFGDSSEAEALWDRPVFTMPEFLSRGRAVTSLQLGTAIHTIMEHLDFNAHKNEEQVSELIASLQEKGLITQEEEAALPVKKIVGFLASGLAERMRRSTCLKREVPFVMGISPYDVYFKDELKGMNETILVHGIIDCYFLEDDMMVLVDYKSDRLKREPEQIELLKKKYALQIKIYKRAVEEAEGKKIKECVLYLFGLDEAVIIT